MKPTTLKQKGFKTGLAFGKFLLLPLLILLITLASCRSDDNEDDAVNNQDLIGLWQPYKLTQRATLSTGDYNQTREFSICEQRARITFSANNSGNAKTFADNNGNCSLQDDANFTYEYNSGSKTLTIKNEDGTTQSGTVISVSTSDLVYELVGTYDFEGESNIEVKSTFYLRRTKD